jgi:predicted HTH transcriptional regulator
LHQDGSATVAGVLMCSQNSDDYLYNSFIQAVYYNGVEKDANYQIDAQDFNSISESNLVNNSLRVIWLLIRVSTVKVFGNAPGE